MCVLVLENFGESGSNVCFFGDVTFAVDAGQPFLECFIQFCLFHFHTSLLINYNYNEYYEVKYLP